ncbi:hypothetical protein [Candidatus Protochlamydia phocaeensis]|uniref:hypothetical protein n=1 Tax=Candidatus Protochlamydia phocaeensis TaxID=1414722 RepID=UPI000837C0A0|nr:hypothetical protein [Candidatus Protochlamydia phocaeensis]
MNIQDNSFNTWDDVLLNKMIEKRQEETRKELREVKSNPILASIREARKSASGKAEKVSRNWLERIKNFINPGSKSVKSQKIIALRKPSDPSNMIRSQPSVERVLKILKSKSNFFTGKQKKFINDLEKFRLPQMAKAKIGYELIEHSSRSTHLTSSLPKISVSLGGESFEVHDGASLDQPVVVHATKMQTAPLILTDKKKFFDDNIKISASLFEKGKMFFHSNDPSEDNPDDPMSHQDYYVALGLSVDPENFYRNYPHDVGSPTYNRDPHIATKGGNDRVKVESHIKMQKIITVLGFLVQDLQQKCYQHLNYDAYLPSPSSNTDRIYKLEGRLQKKNLSVEEKEEATSELEELRKKTGHEEELKTLDSGIVKGEVFYNIRDEIKELVHLSKSIKDENLRKEILTFRDNFEAFIDTHDLTSKLLEKATIGLRLKLLFHNVITKHLGENLRRRLFPYHLTNLQLTKLNRMFGPTELLSFTRDFSYNELEALSHAEAKKVGARPIQIASILMSRYAFEKLKQEKDPTVIQQFKELTEMAKKHHLPIIIVDTAV